MLCYRDRTFCASGCRNHECGRFFTEAMELHADSLNLPVSFADFSKECDDYLPPEGPEE